jgi:RimJ/RimL family protein N-acetyltransferase
MAEIVRNTPQQIETQRLELRQFVEIDWLPLCDFFRDEECLKYTIQTPQQDWQTWRTLMCYIGHWAIRGYGPYAVVEKVSRELVGTVGLWFPGEWPEPELKWALRRCFWGKGYATEASAAVRDMTRRSLKWNRLISLILPANDRSIAVSKRLGGRYERTVPFRGATAQIFGYDLNSDSRDLATNVSPEAVS